MCLMQHMLLIFCSVALIYGRKVNENFPLLEFRELNEVKMIIDYKNIELPISSNIYSRVDELMQDLSKFDCQNDICNVEKRILIDDIVKKNSTLKSISNLKEKNLNRKKREWAPWGKFLKWSGGVMNDEDRNDLHRYLMSIYENQTKMGEQLRKIETKLSEPAALKAEVNDQHFNQVQSDLKQLKENLRMQTFKEQFAQISARIDAVLSSYINGYVDGLLIDEELLNSLDNVRNSLRNDRQYICENSLDCIRNSKAKIIYRNGNFYVSMEMPIASTKTMKLLKIQSLPVAYNSYALILKSEFKYLLLDGENEELIAVNENIISRCIQQTDSSVLFCKAQDIISNVNKLDCLFAAVYENIIDTQLCRQYMELLELESFGIVKMNKGEFWIYTESPKAINIKCNGNEMQIRNITEAEIINLDYGCQAIIKDVELTSYQTVDAKYRDLIQANISVEFLRQIIDIMEPTADLSEYIPYDLETAHPSGLKEKSQYQKDDSWQAKNQWQETEIKVLHAEHNKAIIIALAITVAALLFLVFRKHKSILIVTSSDKRSKEETSLADSEIIMKDQESLSDLPVYWNDEKK